MIKLKKLGKLISPVTGGSSSSSFGGVSIPKILNKSVIAEKESPALTKPQSEPESQAPIQRSPEQSIAKAASASIPSKSSGGRFGALRARLKGNR